MNVIYHPRIPRDLRDALAFYEAEGGSALADRFFGEVEATVAKVVENPERFHLIAPGLRRASLDSFQYHFLYEPHVGHVRFTVLRHDKRHPNYGLKRR